MAETITGKKCPECGSFVPTEAKQCLVCKQELVLKKINTQPLPTGAQPAQIKCPKCRQECMFDARFCHRCGSALGQGEVRDTKEYNQKEAVLTARASAMDSMPRGFNEPSLDATGSASVSNGVSMQCALEQVVSQAGLHPISRSGGDCHPRRL